MKQRSQIRRVSLKRAKELNGKNFSFNSTIRRKTCDAMNAERKKVKRTNRITVLHFALRLESSQTADLSSKVNYGRKPVKKQTEKQRKRLQKLAAVRSRWWKESESSGKQLICGICDEPIRWFEDLASDHINPGSAKSDDESNLQPAHNLCNLLKSSQRNFKIVKGDHNYKLIHGGL